VSYESRTACDRVLRVRREGSVAIVLAAVVTLTLGGAVLPVRSRRQRWRATAVHDGRRRRMEPGRSDFQRRSAGRVLLDTNGSINGRRVTRYIVGFHHGTMQRRIGSRGGNGRGQNVTITEVAGSQTFTLTGTLSSAGSTMMGTYTSTRTAPDGSPCGYAVTGTSYTWAQLRCRRLPEPSPGASTVTSEQSGLANQTSS